MRHMDDARSEFLQPGKAGGEDSPQGISGFLASTDGNDSASRRASTAMNSPVPDRLWREAQLHSLP